MRWLAILHDLAQGGTPAALVTLLAVRGSTPREAGCKMVVTADAAHGTIGGGNLEFSTIAAARALLSGGNAAPVLREFPLGPALGQCCGGHATVLLELVAPPQWHIALYGAGHVGRALIALLATLDCRVSWIDGRAEAFPDRLPPNVAKLPAADPAMLPAGSTMLVMTHDHALDYRLIAAALRRNDLPFVGLIGSDTKRARFVSRLARDGVSAQAIRRLVCPIGVPGTGGKVPAEIAIAVAAQLLQTRDLPAQIAHAPDAACGGCVVAGCQLTGENVA